jgi:hypothetical protein
MDGSRATVIAVLGDNRGREAYQNRIQPKVVGAIGRVL